MKVQLILALMKKLRKISKNLRFLLSQRLICPMASTVL